MPFIILTLLFFVALLVFAIWSKRTYARRRGDWTESKVAKQLAKLPKDEYIVLNDLMLPTSYGTTQIDHVVLSLYGVYVIETKNYTGTLIGNEKTEQWEQNINGFMYKTANALRQNKAHISAVRSHASVQANVPIHNIVVFANATKFDIFHEEGKVIYINDLIPTIMRLRSVEPFYTQEQVQIKANLLLEKNITDPELRKQHNQAANAAKYERRAKIESGICPRCGGQLVIREGKYGQFYGCSNYPKCDFNVKSLRTDYEDINDERRLGRRFYRRKRYW